MRLRRADSLAAATVALIATAAIVAALGALLPRFSTAIGPTSGDPFFTVTILEWVAGRIPHGLAGVWSPPFFHPAGNALVLSDHMFLPAFLYAIPRGLGASPALANNLLLVASFPATALALFALLRRATRAPRWVAGALALAVTFAPWRWGQLVHLLMLWAPGPPLALFTLDRLLVRPGFRRALAFAGAEALTLLSGCYLAFLTQLALVAIVAVRAARRAERRKWLRSWRPLGVAFVLTAAIAVPVYRPYLAARDSEQRRSAAEIAEFDVSARDWVTPSKRSLYAGSLLSIENRRQERELFPGILLTAGSLAALALIARTTVKRFSLARRRDSDRRSLPLPLLGWSMLVAGLFFTALSSAGFFLVVSRWIPGLDSMRVPDRGHLFVLCGFAVLAARSVTALGRSARGPVFRGTAMAAVALAAGLDVVARPAAANEFFALESREVQPDHISWLARPEVGAVAFFPLTGTAAEAPRMWRQQFHGKPIANGRSSYLPPSFRWLRSKCRTPRNRLLPRCLDALEALGVTHFVVEDAWYAAPGVSIPSRIEAAVAPEARDRIRLAFADRGALVFELGSTVESAQ